MPKPSVQIDYARYEKYLAESDLTEDQKQAFLGALWEIVVGFVDMGFGVHPMQQACEYKICEHKDCGKLNLSSDFLGTKSNGEIKDNKNTPKEALNNE